MKDQIQKILQRQGHGWSYLYLRLGQKSASSFFRAIEAKTIKLKTIEEIASVLKVPITELFAEKQSK